MLPSDISTTSLLPCTGVQPVVAEEGLPGREEGHESASRFTVPPRLLQQGTCSRHGCRVQGPHTASLVTTALLLLLFTHFPTYGDLGYSCWGIRDTVDRSTGYLPYPAPNPKSETTF